MTINDNSHLSIWLSGSPDGESDRLSVGEALARGAALWPDQEAVVYCFQPEVNDTRWSFRQLNELAELIAANLLASGYRTGERIAVWGPNHPEWVLLEYALAKAGIVIVALNPLYKASELTYALNTSGAAGIFYADRVGTDSMANIINAVRNNVPSLRSAHAFSSIIQDFASGGQATNSLPAVKPSDIFMIQYTSGTTGLPKAAQLSHGAITQSAGNSYRRWGIKAGNRVCHGFPLFHVGGSGNSIPGAALCGATTYPLYIFKADRTLDILEHERCTQFIGVPTMLTAMLDHPTFSSRDLSSLEYIIAGGSQVSTTLLRRCETEFGVEVINCYGQTETCGVTTSTVFSDSEHTKTTTSGKPLEGVSIKIADKEGSPVEKGVPGQLCYKGPGMMSGYQDDEVNSQAFDKDGWFLTGDLATMDSQNNVIIIGRAREMIIRGGENLSPGEIENYILEHPDVADVAVVGIPDPKYGEVVCAAIRTRSPDHASAEEIHAWCNDRVSRWKVPEYIVFVEQFPTTHSGKIQKHILREQLATRLGPQFRLSQPSRKPQESTP